MSQHGKKEKISSKKKKKKADFLKFLVKRKKNDRLYPEISNNPIQSSSLDRVTPHKYLKNGSNPKFQSLDKIEPIYSSRLKPNPENDEFNIHLTPLNTEQQNTRF